MDGPSDRRLLRVVLVVVVAACVFLLPCATHASATHVRYCGSEDDYTVKVKGVEINPNPVVRGKPAKFSILASTEEAIHGGKLVIGVKYYGVPVHQETHDLCNEASCPVSVGDFEISHKQNLPGITPPGSYVLTMKLFGEGGSELTCISFDFKIKLGSPIADS